MASIMNMGMVVAKNNGVLPCSPTFGPKVAYTLKMHSYLLHLAFMNDNEGLVTLFTRVFSSISCL